MSSWLRISLEKSVLVLELDLFNSLVIIGNILNFMI